MMAMRSLRALLSLLLVLVTLSLTLTKVSAGGCPDDYYYDIAIEFCRPCSGICEEGRWEQACETYQECSAFHEKSQAVRDTKKTETVYKQSPTKEADQPISGHSQSISSKEESSKTGGVKDDGKKKQNPAHYSHDTEVGRIAGQDDGQVTSNDGTLSGHSWILWMVVGVIGFFTILALALHFRRRFSNNESNSVDLPADVRQEAAPEPPPSVTEDVRLSIPQQESQEHLQTLMHEPVDDEDANEFINVQMGPLQFDDLEFDIEQLPEDVEDETAV